MRPLWSGWGGTSSMSGSAGEGAASAATAILTHPAMISLLFGVLLDRPGGGRVCQEGAVLAPVQQAHHGLLSGRGRRGDLAPRHASHLQHRPGLPVHPAAFTGRLKEHGIRLGRDGKGCWLLAAGATTSLSNGGGAREFTRKAPLIQGVSLSKQAEPPLPASP